MDMQSQVPGPRPFCSPRSQALLLGFPLHPIRSPARLLGPPPGGHGPAAHRDGAARDGAAGGGAAAERVVGVPHPTRAARRAGEEARGGGKGPVRRGEDGERADIVRGAGDCGGAWS